MLGAIPSNKPLMGLCRKRGRCACGWPTHDHDEERRAAIRSK